MSVKAAHVAQRIRSELIELERVVQRIQEGWKRAERATAKLKNLIEGLPGLFQQLRAEVSAFADFVEKRP